MKSIRSNFEKVSNKNPNLGSYCCLAITIKGKRFSRKSLTKAYYDLMPKDEYLRSESKAQIDHLCLITEMAEEGEKTAKNEPRE